MRPVRPVQLSSLALACLAVSVVACGGAGDGGDGGGTDAPPDAGGPGERIEDVAGPDAGPDASAEPDEGPSDAGPAPADGADVPAPELPGPDLPPDVPDVAPIEDAGPEVGDAAADAAPDAPPDVPPEVADADSPDVAEELPELPEDPPELPEDVAEVPEDTSFPIEVGPPECETHAECATDDPCVNALCVFTAGTCSFTAVPGCGANPPCEVSDAPGSADPLVTACVCAGDPACCDLAWGPACVLQAEELCGLDCACHALDAPKLACEGDADCAFCGGDPCSGLWTCQAGTCAQAPPVACDPSGDKECLKNLCQPETGACELTLLDGYCDDGDACTTEICDPASGFCLGFEDPDCAQTHPCATSTSPLSSDEAVNACLCDYDTWCCEGAWDEICVAEAQEVCGLVCDCAALPAAELSCDDVEDCGWCPADTCTGDWLCLDGVCTAPDAVVCDGADDTECVVNACQPDTGACAVTVSDALCDDGYACTADACDADAGACTNQVVEACGAAHPCLDAPPGCASDADCEPCEDGDACDGAWTCEDGACAPTPPVDCDDEEPCTVDTCDPATGACTNEPLPDCGTNHPCVAVATPGTADALVAACVCDPDSVGDAYCCEASWDALCVGKAVTWCGLVCECDDPAADLACAEDADCAWCDDGDDGDLCDGTWACDDGACAPVPPVVCDPADDVGCLLGGCDPETGACVLVPWDPACDDETVCTSDACDAATGDCLHDAIEGCGDNDPCQASEHPTSADPEVDACVCGPEGADDPYCCTVAWDAVCVSHAIDACDVVCDCALLSDDDLACATDADCAPCDPDGDPCDGTWTCEAGTCAPVGPVECDPEAAFGCLTSTCDPATGACGLLTTPGACDDDDPCTADACDAVTGECVATPVEGCGGNSPCEVSDQPGSSDPDITACVCAFDLFCCKVEWDELCVEEAVVDCGATCP